MILFNEIALVVGYVVIVYFCLIAVLYLLFLASLVLVGRYTTYVFAGKWGCKVPIFEAVCFALMVSLKVVGAPIKFLAKFVPEIS